MAGVDSSSTRAKFDANDKLHFMYLVWVSLGCPPPDTKYLCNILDIKQSAATMRFTRLKAEMKRAGLPASKDEAGTEGDLTTAAKPKANKAKANGKATKKGKRAFAAEGEEEGDCKGKKIKTEVSDCSDLEV